MEVPKHGHVKVQQKMFAKNRCRVASFSLRCLRLSKRFGKKTEQMHPEVGVYLQTEDWNDDDAHPNYVEMSTPRTLRFILQALRIMCAFTWYNCT